MKIDEIISEIKSSRIWHKHGYVEFPYFVSTDVKDMMGNPIKIIDDETKLFFGSEKVPSKYYRSDNIYAVINVDRDESIYTVFKTVFTDEKVVDYLVMNEDFGFFGISELLYKHSISMRRPLKDTAPFQTMQPDEVKAFQEKHDFSFLSETNFMQHYNADMTGMKMPFGDKNLFYFKYKDYERILFYE